MSDDEIKGLLAAHTNRIVSTLATDDKYTGLAFRHAAGLAKEVLALREALRAVVKYDEDNAIVGSADYEVLRWEDLITQAKRALEGAK